MLPIFVLAYSSRTLLPADAEFLRSILASAKRNNVPEGITGFLCVRDGYFLQVIEGIEANVRARYAKIARDTRHQSVVLLAEAHVESRIFPAWTMGLVRVEEGSNSSAALLELFALGRAGTPYTDVRGLMAALRMFSKDVEPYDP